ncbi:MAG: HAD family hydrolase [Bacteroidota bacterium]
MIKTIIFDFGDVFLTLNKPATQKKLKDFGLENFSNEMIHQNQLYEMGKISTEEFVNFYTEQIEGLSKQEFIDAWNSILIEFPKHKLDFIKELSKSKKYRLILLSNTNNLHINWIKENINCYEEFKQCFDVFYLSQDIHFRKPNLDIYEFVIKQNQLVPEETLFVDDTPENTEAAKKLGIKIWNINPNTDDVSKLFITKSSLF